MAIVYLFAVIGFIVVFIPAFFAGVSKLNRIGKLRILRAVILAVSTAVIVAAKIGVKAAQPFEYPLIWLRHYVWGSGKAMHVPDHLVQQAKEAFRETLNRYYAYEGWDSYAPDRSSDDPFGAYHCLYHSTIYEGSGFYNRPTLFYLLGGFTFLLRRDGKVSGKDHYDWHPTKDGKYFTSPLGTGKVAAICMAIADKVFGHEWFVVGGFPSGEHGISNKLWDDLRLVGAREFNSWFDQVEIFSDKELDEIYLMSYLNGDVKRISGVNARAFASDAGIWEHYFLVDENGNEPYLFLTRRGVSPRKIYL